MRKEMIIRVQTSSDKGHYKAIKVAAAIQGVESVTIAGEDKSLLLVIGVGIDSNRITERLRRKVGHAEVVELRTVDAAAADELGGLVVADHAYRYHPSPSPYGYKQHQHAAVARDHYYGAGTGGYPRGDHYYSTGGGSAYAPAMGGARDYYYYGAGAGGGYPAQQQQHDYYLHYPAAANTHTVVHHEYVGDPNSCSLM